MHTFDVTLVPRDGGVTFTARIQANSDAEARRIAKASYPGHEVRACNYAH